MALHSTHDTKIWTLTDAGLTACHTSPIPGPWQMGTPGYPIKLFNSCLGRLYGEITEEVFQEGACHKEMSEVRKYIEVQ